MSGWACVARYGGIGDNLIAGSVLRPIKRLGYKTEFICSAPHHVVMQNNPFIDKLSVKVPERDLPQGDLMAWQKWHEGRKGEFDLFVHLSHSVEGRHAVFSSMSAFWWPQDYRRKLCAGNYLETAMDIAGVPHEFGPLYFPTEDEVVRAKAAIERYGKGRRIIGWVIAGSRLDKVYPFVPQAAQRVIEECNATVMLIGAGAKQFSMAEATQATVFRALGPDAALTLALSPEDNPNLISDFVWNTRRSLALAHQCDLIVTPDTGFAWATAFEPMPKIVLLSHASAENITKWWVNTTSMTADPARVPCVPCHRLHDDPSTCVPATDMHDGTKAAACMADISVDRLVSTIKAKLKPRTRYAAAA